MVKDNVKTISEFKGSKGEKTQRESEGGVTWDRGCGVSLSCAGKTGQRGPRFIGDRQGPRRRQTAKTRGDHKWV